MGHFIEQQTIEFLQDLADHNHREWFQDHKAVFKDTHQNFKNFVAAVRGQLKEFDEIEKTKVYRIYRDLRFSKDKTPYKTYYSAHFTRQGKFRRGGFYMEISGTEALIAGGFWKPESTDLQYFREGIARDADALRQALEKEHVKVRFDGLSGAELKTAPRGVDRDHPEIDLLRKKQFLLIRRHNLEQVLQKDFYKEVAADFQAMIPVLDVLTDYLVYDGNGEERIP